MSVYIRTISHPLYRPQIKKKCVVPKNVMLELRLWLKCNCLVNI